MVKSAWRKAIEEFEGSHSEKAEFENSNVEIEDDNEIEI